MSAADCLADGVRRKKAGLSKWQKAARETTLATSLLSTMGLAQRRHRIEMRNAFQSHLTSRDGVPESERAALDIEFTARICELAQRSRKLASDMVTAWKHFEKVMQSHTDAKIRDDGGRITGICDMAHATGSKVATCTGTETARELETCSVVVSQSVRDAEQEYNHAIQVLARQAEEGRHTETRAVGS